MTNKLFTRKSVIQIDDSWSINKCGFFGHICRISICYFRTILRGKRSEYNSDPAISLITKVSNEYIPFDDCIIEYSSLDDLVTIDKTNDEYLYGKNDLFSLIIMFKILLEKKEFRMMMKEIEYELELLDGRVDSISLNRILDRMGFPPNFSKIAEM